MGYYTNYEVRAVGFEDEDSAEFFIFKLDKFVGEKLSIEKEEDWSTGELRKTYRVHGYISERKWYNWEDNLKEMSLKFKDVLIEVEGHGEEDEDIWRARIKNGDSEIVKAEIVFPAFTKF